MFDELLTKIFGSRNDRLIKQYRRKCDAINKLEPAMQALSDEELKAKTQEFRDRIAKGALRRAAHRRNGSQRRQDR